MQRIGFRSSKLSIASSGQTYARQSRLLSSFAVVATMSVCGMLGCSSEPETPVVAQNAAPGAQAAAPGMAAGMAPGMPSAGMPGGAAMDPQQMAQMQGGGAAANPMPMGANSGSGAAMTPEQMAKMQGAGAAANPMPPGADGAMTPEQMAKLRGAGGNPMAQPGAAGIPGGAAGSGLAGGPGGGGVPQNPTAQVGTAEYSAQKVVLQLLGGELSGLEEFISPKCKGMLGDVRDGKATDQQKVELQKLFNGLQATGKPKLENGAKVITVRNAEGAIITFKVKKEGEDQKVTEMTVKQSTTKRR